MFGTKVNKDSPGYVLRSHAEWADLFVLITSALSLTKTFLTQFAILNIHVSQKIYYNSAEQTNKNCMYNTLILQFDIDQLYSWLLTCKKK